MRHVSLSFLALAGLTSVAPASANSEVTDKSAKPNIVIITTDQQSYNTISALAALNKESSFYSLNSATLL